MRIKNFKNRLANYLEIHPTAVSKDTSLLDLGMDCARLREFAEYIGFSLDTYVTPQGQLTGIGRRFIREQEDSLREIAKVRARQGGYARIANPIGYAGQTTSSEVTRELIQQRQVLERTLEDTQSFLGISVEGLWNLYEIALLREGTRMPEAVA